MPETIAPMIASDSYQVDSRRVAAEMLAKGRLLAVGRRHMEAQVLPAPVARAIAIAAAEIAAPPRLQARLARA